MKIVWKTNKQRKGFMLNVWNADQIDKTYSFILGALIESSEYNDGRSKHGYRYSDVLKYFCQNWYIKGGKDIYETLAPNLPIPIVHKIHRYIWTKTYRRES